MLGLGTLLAASIAWAQLPTPEPHRAPAALAVGKYDVKTHAAEISGKDSYTANGEHAVAVKLTAKGGYHINEKYPLKFKASSSDSVTYPKPLLTRNDGKFGPITGELKVPFVPTRAGKAKVGGTLFFSVCDDKNCLMDKVDLEVEVNVK
jgi:hypothetical protein